MGRSHRHHEKYEHNREASHDNYNEGTAARTRPFSFDEIMLRRKNKKPVDDVKDAGPTAIPVKNDIVENVSHSYRSDKVHRHDRDSSSGPTKRTREEENLGKGRDKESQWSEARLKAKPNSDTSTKARGEIIDKRIHSRSRYDERSREHSRDLLGKDRYTERSGGKAERESKRKHDSGKLRDSEISHYEETRPKRRRSRSHEHAKDRSREHARDRNRRSVSRSPRAQKRSYHHEKEHKDRPLIQHSNVDRNGISSNGSSSQHRRPSESASGLGGYSPRKRRTEVAVKTPSPSKRSPEKKSAGWDLPPARTDTVSASSGFTDLPSSQQTVLLNVPDFTAVRPISWVTSNVLSTKSHVSIDSVQLTQATRPMRRLYVENLPASASEKAIMECLNSFLLTSSGVNYIQGTQPCISCIIHKEKAEALVEFLRPEDASAALLLNGRSFSGSILKIRRPKDFVEVATGLPQKAVAAVDTISDFVKDSPHKIFVAGISRVLSSTMLRDIVSVFGPLKAFHFEVDDIEGPHAFLEYIDQSIAHRACAGLNGMKLGGQVLTVVQAMPNASFLENTGNNRPFYGVPEHAKPLLQKPTQVLMLKNVVDPEGFSSLSEPELEEMLEDIRLECSRFGTVKSVNIVKHHKSCTAVSDTREVIETNDLVETQEILGQDLKTQQNLGHDDKNVKIETLEERVDDVRLEPQSNVEELAEVDKVEQDNLIKNEEPSESGHKDGDMPVEDTDLHCNLKTVSQEIVLHDQKGTSDIENKLNGNEELDSVGDDAKIDEAFVELDSNVGSKLDSIDDLELGCVLVEFLRTEASCIAAHTLHGRLFDNRIVAVEYVSHHLYQAKFPK